MIINDIYKDFQDLYPIPAAKHFFGIYTHLTTFRFLKNSNSMVRVFLVLLVSSIMKMNVLSISKKKKKMILCVGRLFLRRKIRKTSK